jgi:hypothetical protein
MYCKDEINISVSGCSSVIGSPSNALNLLNLSAFHTKTITSYIMVQIMIHNLE